MAEQGGAFLDKLDGVLGGTVGAWLKGQLKQVMSDAGLEPVDLRLRKPVLVNSQDVLDQAGFDQAASVRELVSALPDAGSAEDFARSVGLWLTDEVGTDEFTVAELPIPGRI